MYAASLGSAMGPPWQMTIMSGRTERPAAMMALIFYAVIKGERGLGADGALGGKTHMGNEYVRTGFGHGLCLLGIEYVGAGEHVKLMCLSDHLDLKAVAHAGLFEVLAEYTVDQADGREILDAVEALILELLEVDVHHAEGVCAAYAGEDRSVLNDGEHLCAHLNNELVCIAIGQQSCEGAAACHTVTA